jgi:hypothetical protein
MEGKLSVADIKGAEDPISVANKPSIRRAHSWAQCRLGVEPSCHSFVKSMRFARDNSETFPRLAHTGGDLDSA